MQQWEKEQKKAVKVNIAVSLSFLTVCAVLGWVYISFHAGHTALFGISLLMMVLLMALFTVVLWKGTERNQPDKSLPESQYLLQYIETLRWRRKTITTYTWYYTLTLWSAMMCYMFDVLAEASLQLKIIAPLVTTLYIFGMQLFIKKKTRRKQISKIDSMIQQFMDILNEDYESSS